MSRPVMSVHSVSSWPGQRRSGTSSRMSSSVTTPATAFISPKWWDAAPGHLLVVPNEHHETVYAIPDEALAAVYRTAKALATALTSVSGSEGTSMRQHNAPGGGQDVWHFHVHVFPRRVDDQLYERNSETHLPTLEQRGTSPSDYAACSQPTGCRDDRRFVLVAHNGRASASARLRTSGFSSRTSATWTRTRSSSESSSESPPSWSSADPRERARGPISQSRLSCRQCRGSPPSFLCSRLWPSRVSAWDWLEAGVAERWQRPSPPRWPPR